MHLIGVLAGVMVALSITCAETRPAPYFYNEYSSEEELNDDAIEPSNDSFEESDVKYIAVPAEPTIEEEQAELVETLDKTKITDILNDPKLSAEERYAAIAQLAVDKFAETDEKNPAKNDDHVNSEIENQQDKNKEDTKATDELKANVEKQESESINENDVNADKAE